MTKSKYIQIIMALILYLCVSTVGIDKAIAKETNNTQISSIKKYIPKIERKPAKLSCSVVRGTFPKGVKKGKNTKDKKVALFSRKVTYVKSKAVYEPKFYQKYKYLDKDNDGIICE